MAAGGVRSAKRVRAASPVGEPVGVRTRSSKKPALAPLGEDSNEQPPANEQEQVHPNVQEPMNQDTEWSCQGRGADENAPTDDNQPQNDGSTPDNNLPQNEGNTLHSIFYHLIYNYRTLTPWTIYL